MAEPIETPFVWNHVGGTINCVLDGRWKPGSPVLRGRGNLGRIYQPIVRYGISGMSQRNSVGGSSNAAFCCQYHRHRIDNI